MISVCYVDARLLKLRPELGQSEIGIVDVRVQSSIISTHLRKYMGLCCQMLAQRASSCSLPTFRQKVFSMICDYPSRKEESHHGYENCIIILASCFMYVFSNMVELLICVYSLQSTVGWSGRYSSSSIFEDFQRGERFAI